HRDAHERRHPSGGCPAGSETRGCILEPTAADEIALELVFDQVLGHEETRPEGRELHGLPVSEESSESLALVLAQIAVRGIGTFQHPRGPTLLFSPLLHPNQATQRGVDNGRDDMATAQLAAQSDVSRRRTQ